MGERGRITIIMVENRMTIAAILADLLTAAGYQTRSAVSPADAREMIATHLPAILLADVGMFRPEQQAEWQELEATATTLEVPMLRFSCSPLPEGARGDVLVLRSPSDFAAVVEKVEEEWHHKQPFLGTALVQMGCLKEEELEVALRLQRDLVQLGRHYTLGDLLLRLGLVGPEDVENALRRQEAAG